ncbi:type IV secretion system protein, partial [Cupriavidus sp. CP313]
RSPALIPSASHDFELTAGPLSSNLIYATRPFEANGIAEALKALGVAIPIVLVLILTGIPFLGISAAYAILAKFSLGLLLALGPLFIAAALFPATRKFFETWTAQCLNYAFLTALFAAAAAIEVQFATSILRKDEGYVMGIVDAYVLGAMGLVFIVVSLNLPGLASALAGGVGISTMTGKISTAANMAGKLANAFKGKGGGGGGGISPT